uniref:Abnormal cell migration protein 18-like fibronectin type I domain-containing protein n=1 Tax=Romanomermis culicivorax TaxID=13658 RepID=A0A915KW47_ROMCU
MKNICRIVLLILFPMGDGEAAENAPEALISPGASCKREGQELRKFGQYYTCKSKRLELTGCLGEYDMKVPIGRGHTFQSSDYEWACHRMSEKWALIAPVVCWYKGKAYQPTEVHIEKPFYYTCTKRAGKAEFVASGCLNSKDEQLLPGQNFQAGSYIYACRYQEGTMRIDPVACMYDGKEILLNDELVHPNYAFTCRKRAGGGIEFAATSCVHHGKKYLPGRQYVKGHFIFQCHSANNRISHEVVGCVDDSKRLYSSGERWIQGNGTLRYVTECNITSGRAVKMVVQCLYQGAEGSILLNPGCMKKFGEIMLLCQKLPSKVEFRVFLKSSESNEKNALKMGYKYC